ncbi:MAG: ATP-binding cassette domain-containing protein, partial [Clostridia bacterium]|nr:ATP-binding cassette domain-containing protein [Clostridia bacterium]
MLLEFKNVTKSYGKTKALTDFSAVLEPGVHALLGPNGSGKSTLMNILTDNLKADSGSIMFDGEDVLKMGARFREELGFMPQYYRHTPRRTGFCIPGSSSTTDTPVRPSTVP